MKPGVLVVEDEPAISESLAEHLIREGFDAEVTGTIEDAVKAAPTGGSGSGLASRETWSSEGAGPCPCRAPKATVPGSRFGSGATSGPSANTDEQEGA